jgi:hypothetical protein
MVSADLHVLKRGGVCYWRRILDRCEREAANTYAVEEIPEEAF